MNSNKRIRSGVISKYRIKLVLVIASLWTIIDTGVYLFKFYRDHIDQATQPFDMHSTTVIILRLVLIFFICLAMAYLLIYQLKHLVRNLFSYSPGILTRMAYWILW